MRVSAARAILLTLLAAAAACEPTAAPTAPELAPQFARGARAGAGPIASPYAQIALEVDQFNAQLAASGQTLRLDYPWLFVVGRGTDPFQSLRTGPRWTTFRPTYVLDESDYPTDLPASEVDAALASAYGSWNQVAESRLAAIRVPDSGANFDVLDGWYDADGNCVDLFDYASPNLDLAAGEILPEADIVVGGWVPEAYFSQCLGSADIIGVTWTFYDFDANGDQYLDLLYVEQFYNPAFEWVTSGSAFLDFASGVDIETIAVHENGHAHGLGHFGGPLPRQPFRLKPNGRLFNPEAVMNPFYAYGEDRSLHPTDEAALRTLYSGLH